MIVNASQKLPVKMWFENEADLESGAWDQVKNLANLPFLYKWVAIMPDAHQGYGMPIGGVLPTKDVIIPNAVGVDIGCGMCAVKTSITDINIDQIKQIMGLIRKRVPVGFNKHDKTQKMPDSLEPVGDLTKENWQASQYQLGTLGGGNHFIELQMGNDGHLWLMIHSGSRAMGYKTANFYNKKAVEINEKWRSEVPKHWELAFLPMGETLTTNYIKEMNYCVKFAYENRKLMMDRVQESVNEVIDSSFEEMINIAHNYAQMENHYGQNVWVHRKGATKATEGLVGIIPGSQGAKSYIVKGKGNRDSFTSCSHGAGRTMGRKQAKQTLNLKEQQKRLEGVIHSVRNENDLDEAPGAYKDIQTVIANQTDLIDIEVELTPLGVVKG